MHILRLRSFQALIVMLIICGYQNTQPVYATDLMPQCGEESWAVTNHQIKLDGNYEIASVVDQAQNLIVVTTTKGTGNNRHEWVTLKYSAQGQLLWRYVYPGPGDANGNYDDQGYGVAVDTADNIYVTGNSLGLTGQDVVTVKLSPTGTEEWVQTFDGAAPDPGAQYDSAMGIAVANAHVYTFAQSWGNATHTGNILLIYTLDGTLVSQQELPATPTGVFTFQPSGDWAMSGLQDQPLADPLVYLGHYDAAGVEQWHITYRSTDKNNLKPVAITTDTQQNLYLVLSGYRPDDQNHQEAISVLLKYSATGQLLWERIYYTLRTGVAVTVDRLGNVYVLGDLDDPNAEVRSGTLALKYDANGVLTTRFMTPLYEQIRPLAIALDGDSGVVIAGGSDIRESTSYADTYTTMYFSPNGAINWTARHPGSYGQSAPLLQVVAQTHIYQTGFTLEANGLLLVRYPLLPPQTLPQIHIEDLLIADGDETPADRRLRASVTIALDRPAPDTIDVEYFTRAGTAQPAVDYETVAGRALLVKGDQKAVISIPIIGNTTVATGLQQFSVHLGCIEGAASIDAQATVTLLDDDVDRRLWTQRYGDSNINSFVPYQARVDQDDQLYVLGGHVANGQTTGRLVQITPTGASTWHQTVAIGNNMMLQLDQNQRALYTTAYPDAAANTDTFTQRTSFTGAVIWQHQFDSSVMSAHPPLIYHDLVSVLANDHAGNVVIAGQREPTGQPADIPHTSDAFVTVINPVGATKWTQYYAGPGDSIDQVAGVGIDGAGNVYLVGSAYLSPTEHYLFWCKYDATGTLQRAQLFAFSDTVLQRIDATHVDEQGVTTVSAFGNPSRYTMRIGTDGAIRWRSLWPATSEQLRQVVSPTGITYLALGATLFVQDRQGQTLATQALPLGAFSPQSIAIGANDWLYTATERGYVSAMDQLGNRLWRQSTTEIANAPPGLILQIAAPLASQGTYVLGYFRDNSAAGFQLMVQRYQAPLLPLQADLQSIRVKEAIDQPTVAQVPVVLSAISQQAVTLSYSTQPATASAATDYIQQAGTLTIPAGQRLGAIDIIIAADAQVENPERFYIRLDSVQSGIAGNSRATVTILDATAQELFLPVVANR